MIWYTLLHVYWYCSEILDLNYIFICSGPNCPDGQSLQFGPIIPPSCENMLNYTTIELIEGCFCQLGTIFDSQGICVPYDQCYSEFDYMFT